MPVNYDRKGNIKSASASNMAEARLAIKELRYKKREYGLQKKQISTQITHIRINTRNKIIIMGKSSKPSLQAYASIDIGKLESKKSEIDQYIMQIDQCIINLQRHMDKER